MVREEDIERLINLTGESNTELWNTLLEDAQEQILAYTNRTSMISVLYKPARDLALTSFNRMGTEGENSRSEGGESYSFDNAPKQIYDILNRYRLVRIGGRTYEAKKEQS